MSLVDEQVARGSQQTGDVAGPGSQIVHPAQRALPGIDQIGALGAQRNAGDLGDQIATGDAEIIGSALRRSRRHLAEIDPDHGLCTCRNEGDVLETVTALRMHHRGRRQEQWTKQIPFTVEQG